MRKREAILKELAVKLRTIHLITGGKGPEWRRAVQATREFGPLPARDWLHIFVSGIRSSRRRGSLA